MRYDLCEPALALQLFALHSAQLHTPPADNGGELKFAAGSQRKVGWGWLAAIEASQGLYLENIQTELYILPLFVTMVTAQSDHDQHHHVSNHQQDADLSVILILIIAVKKAGG